jgi:hypothetical protein
LINVVHLPIRIRNPSGESGSGFWRFKQLQTSSKPPGICEFTLNAANVEFKFTNNKPDAGLFQLVAPRNVDGIWEMLHVALVAATSDDARSLIIPVYYDDELSQISCGGLTGVAEVLRPSIHGHSKPRQG